MFDFLHTLAKGGIVMVPLGLCSLASLTVLIERFAVLRRASAGTDPLMTDLRGCIARNDLLSALEKSDAVPGPVAAVLAQGIKAELSGYSPEQAMEEEAMIQVPLLQRRLAVLDTVVTVAPLLGLLGTVVGMITSFHILAIAGTEHPAGITSGIAEALIATATGLVIAIFSLVGLNWCQEKVRSIGVDIEQRVMQLSNWLAQVQLAQLAQLEREHANSLAAV